MKSEIDQLMSEFFHAVSFEEGAKPPYDRIYNLFIESGLLIKNSLTPPEIATVSQFIEPRAVLVASGRLVSFKEVELAEITEIFGNVAHRLSTYEKTGVQDGVPFTVRGVISTQFVKTSGGWRMSAMAWDDERPGLSIPDRYMPPV